MADMLTIATLSANTFKKALEVTSHNVANVATEGYNRQKAIISSNAPGTSATNFNGSGSQISGIEREYSSFYQSQLVVANSLKAKYEEQMSLGEQVEGIVASNDEGVQEFMNRFFESLQSLSNNPTSNTSRQLVLDEAGSLESHIDNLTTVLDESQFQLNNLIRDSVTEVNDRLDAIQELNKQIDFSFKTTGQQPNDLLDKRDQAILEIGEYVDIRQYANSNGTTDVYTANGKVPLISGNTITKLESASSEYSADGRREVYVRIGDERRVLSDDIQGGRLGGIFEYRREMLDGARDDLGLTLNAVTASMNWQHYQGYTLAGDAGGDIFQPLQATGFESTNNDGNMLGSDIIVSFNPNPTDPVQPPYTAAQPATYAAKQASLDNANDEIGNFRARSYELIYDSTAPASFRVVDYDTKNPVQDSTGSPITISAADGWAKNIEGMHFDLSGAVASGTPQDEDTFLVRPHQAILENFNKVISETSDIASRGQSPNPADLAPTAAAAGDNTNIANLAGLQNKKLLLSDGNGATENLLGGYSTMAANVGMFVRSTDIQLAAQTNVYEQVNAQREAFSGVSLDEEAANLIRFQQAYQATAQIIQNVQQMFQTLLRVAGG